MSRPKPPDEAPKAMSFEESLERLEAIVEQLDGGDVPLDKALALFEEGTKLAALCRAQLEKAEVQVKEAARRAGEREPAERSEADE